MNTIKPFQIPKQLVWQAWLNVKANAGSAGIDNQSIKSFEANLGKNLYKLWNRMSSGTYFPPAVKGVAIPKKTGGERMLGIPTVTDRIAQTTVKLLLEPEMERIFLSDSYGYRANKSAHDAISVTRQRCWKYNWVLEFDIRGLFDNIRHDLLMKAVRKHTGCKWALLYIERWLKVPMELPSGEMKAREKGTPQGGCISPLLSNLFMHYAFDLWMTRNRPNNSWCRYADDGLAHCKTLKEAEQLKEALKERFEECGLEMHPDKTKIVYCKDGNRQGDYSEVQFEFLGYCFRRRQAKNERTGQLFDSFLPAMSTRALKTIKETIRREWNLGSKVHVSLKEIAEEINPRTRGWINYYGRYYGSSLSKLKSYIDQALVGWARRKYKKLKENRWRRYDWLAELKNKFPKLFVHWYLGKAY